MVILGIQRRLGGNFSCPTGGAKVQVTGYRLQVIGYRSQVKGIRSQVTGHRLQVTGNRLQVTGHNKIYDDFVFGSYQFISYLILDWYSLFIPTNLFLYIPSLRFQCL